MTKNKQDFHRWNVRVLHQTRTKQSSSGHEYAGLALVLINDDNDNTKDDNDNRQTGLSPKKQKNCTPDHIFVYVCLCVFL